LVALVLLQGSMRTALGVQVPFPALTREMIEGAEWNTALDAEAALSRMPPDDRPHLRVTLSLNALRATLSREPVERLS